MTNEAWLVSVREHRYVEAAARARVGGAPSDVAASLEDLANVERAVREKRYRAAKRALARYTEGLAGVQQAGALRGEIDDNALQRGLDALEATEHERIQDVPELRDRLTPAFEQPLLAPEAHNALGVLHALRGETDAARSAFEQVLELDSRHYRALTNIGNLLLEAGDASGAEGYYRRALELNPEYSGAHHNLAVSLRRQRKMTASVRSFKTGQRLLARQSTADGRADARERIGKSGANLPWGKWGRWLLIAVALVVVWYLLRGGGA